MLDINLIRENPERVKKSQRKRDESTEVVDKVLKYDKKWREYFQRSNKLKHKRNKVTNKISKLKSEGKSAEEEIKSMQKLKEKIKTIDEKLEDYKTKRDALLWKIPNILHESVPKGEDELDNVPIRYWGKKPKFGFEPLSQIELLEKNNLANFQRATKTTGSRFYFLKGKLVSLELAVLKFALTFIKEKGYLPLRVPHMMNREALNTAVSLEDFEDVIYKIKDEDRYLIGTAEHPLTAMHMNETLLEKNLPKKYVAWSTCFRKEAGTHGKFSKGIYRLHDFFKVEQYVLCKPEDSWNVHEELIKNAEDIMKKLGIHYRVVNICTGDMGTIASKKYDIEAWMPGSGKYGEVVSCSNCLSYQARRANIKYREEKGKKPKGYVHTLNSTAAATPRLLIALLEQYQQKDGSIKVPKVLHPYLDFEVIRSE